MKALLIIIIGAACSWHFTDIASDSVAYAVIAPLGVGASLIAFLLWVVMFFHRRGISQTSHHNGDSGGYDGFGDGGDC